MVECTQCRAWSHNNCIGMTDAEKQLILNGSHTWMCSDCIDVLEGGKPKADEASPKSAAVTSQASEPQRQTNEAQLPASVETLRSANEVPR